MKIIFFGPNGSGKGTQGAIIKEKYGIPHIETGVIFRENISQGTTLGKEAKEYIDRGELVPDNITIPMIFDRLSKDDCRESWLLDGFPRNISQAKEIYEALCRQNIKLDIIIEIVLGCQTAKNRIMGRRLCVNDNNHPNNIYIESIKPSGDKCRICGGQLKIRNDDQDEAAIAQRHNIYYDTEKGTMAAVNFFKKLYAEKGSPKVIELDGTKNAEEVFKQLVSKLSNQ